MWNGSTQIWDENDEYHDDEDPGYRIREIYEASASAVFSQCLGCWHGAVEAELLAELSHKLGSTKTETATAGALSRSGSQRSRGA